MNAFPSTGSWVELPHDINAIPAGVYRVTGVDECMIHFRVGKSVAFAVSCEALPMLHAVPESKAILVATTVKAFVERYYTLLEEQRKKPFDPFQPVTMCALSADLMPSSAKRRSVEECH